MKIKSYKELKAWQKSMDLVVLIYEYTDKFPKKEQFGLTGQIRRQTISIPLDVAEGWGRGSTKEYIQFLYIARGFALEMETALLISLRLNYGNKKTYNKIQRQLTEILKLLNSYLKKLKSSIS